mgnify:CR=1 FL=1
MEEKKPGCPILDVDGVISGGKQFDLDITLPEDNRDVIYGVIKDCYREPVCDAVVKLIEVVKHCGKEEHLPVSHTFTDKDGSFVFGPLCPGKEYEVQKDGSDDRISAALRILGYPCKHHHQYPWRKRNFQHGPQRNGCNGYRSSDDHAWHLPSVTDRN